MKRLFAVLMVCLMLFSLTACTGSQYKKAVELKETKKYEEAWTIFQELGDYKDSQEQYKECRYKYAGELFSNRDYEAAAPIYQELGDYEDAADYYEQITDPVSAFAKKLGKSGIQDNLAANVRCDIQATEDGFSIELRTISTSYSNYRSTFECVWSSTKKCWSYTIDCYSPSNGTVIGEGIIFGERYISVPDNRGTASSSYSSNVVGEEFDLCMEGLRNAYDAANMKVEYKWLHNVLSDLDAYAKTQEQEQ